MLPAKRVFVYQLHLPNFQGLDSAEQLLVQQQLNSALRLPRVRLLSQVRPIDPSAFESTRRGLIAQVAEPWRAGMLQEEVRSIANSLETTPAWNVQHYLLSWDVPLAGLVSAGYAALANPPDVLAGASAYEVLPEYLKPQGGTGLYIKALGVYELRPPLWTWELWAKLIARAQGEMAVAVDFERVPDDVIRREMVGLKNRAQARQGDDEETLRRKNTLLALLETDEPFYRLQVVILLRDTLPERLLARARALRQSHEAYLGISPLVGHQEPPLEFFSSRPNVSVRFKPTTVLAPAIPVVVSGLASTDNLVNAHGVYLGFRQGWGEMDLGPIYWRAWNPKDNPANHIGFLGRTGGGKTVGMMALTARERLTRKMPVVYIDPLGNVGRLANLLQHYGDPGLRFHRLTYQSVQLNPLDWVGENQAEQDLHVVALLQTLLNRALTELERTLVVLALRKIYAGLSELEREDPLRAPRLEFFCECLRNDFREHRHGGLAADLADALDFYVSGGQGAIFNRPTNLHLAFDGADLFDVQGVAGQGTGGDSFKTILYYMMLMSFVRVARRAKQAGQKQPRLLALDELHALTRVPWLYAQLTELTKTARNLHLWLWFAEQNLATYVGLRSANDAQGASLQGHLMATNMPNWIAFRQDPLEAQLLHQTLPDRCPASLAEALPKVRRGSCLALLDTYGAALCHLALLPSERRFFITEEVNYRPAEAGGFRFRRPV